jgi:uncharacterized membrane protein (UPF0127 family)
MKYVLLPLIILVLFAVYILAHNASSRERGRGGLYALDLEYSDATLTINDDVVLDVAIADTPTERMWGLSRQQNILKNQGLLFRFPSTDVHGIWMKDMYFAIDIIWLDETFTVVDIKENATPKSFRTESDAEVFKPKSPALYVLEVQGGFVETYGIRIGDTFLIKEKS